MSISPKWKRPMDDAIRDFLKNVIAIDKDDDEEISEDYVSLISKAIEKVENRLNDDTSETSTKATDIYEATFDLLAILYVTFES